MKEKLFTKNRKGENISVLLDINEDRKGLAFVMHGLGGFKEQPHIQTFAESFLEEGISVVLFDSTNTLGSGESDGNYENATTTNYYEDLEDVIKWAKEQEWYQEPFYLCGHSLGGISIALFAEKFPNKVKGLVPISTVVSGKLSMEKDEVADWKRTGWRIKESKSEPGRIKKLPWSHMEDRLKYDLLEKVDRLTMPVLLVVGETDESTPSRHQQILFGALPGEKELHIIKGAPHTFREKVHLDEMKKIMKEWIKKVNK